MKQYPLNENYLVTEDGKIYDKVKKVWLKTRVKDDGYILVTLGGKNERLHRVVCITYHKNPDNKPEVNHLDGDKGNNHKDNLEWVTSKENKDHAWSLGLYKDVCENHHSAVYTDEQIHKACKMMEDGYRNKDVAEILHIDKDAVSHIRRGSLWKDISKDYNLKVSRVHRKSVESIVKICTLLEEGKSNTEIVSITGNLFSSSEVNRIRVGATHKEISSNFKIPKSKFSRLTEETVFEICHLIQEGYKNCEIAKKLSVTVSAVSKIKRRETWTHLSKDFCW